LLAEVVCPETTGEALIEASDFFGCFLGLVDELTIFGELTFGVVAVP